MGFWQVSVTVRKASSLVQFIGVVQVPIPLVDNAPLDVALMGGPPEVPRGQTHPILTHGALMSRKALEWWTCSPMKDAQPVQGQ